jgi:hypothetical protein
VLLLHLWSLLRLLPPLLLLLLLLLVDAMHMLLTVSGSKLLLLLLLLWVAASLLRLLLQDLIIQPRHCCQQLHQTLLLHAVQPGALPGAPICLCDNSSWRRLPNCCCHSQQACWHIAVPLLPQGC